VRVLVLNGPNLDVLHRRDPALYGGISLQELETLVYAWGSELGLTPRCEQTNHEGRAIDLLHEALDWAEGLLINPGAWTHYSYALRDALELFTAPIAEVHLSNIEAREEFRRHSVIAEIVTFRVMGKGPDGYREALELLAQAGTQP
jgi:3-dehydroquinate dehydratase-2